MNVLAAPFLYTMPSEIEAFFCFAKFIEEACPLYVQPTLEGVHRGLKVSLLNIWKIICVSQIISSWIGVWNLWTLSSMATCVQKIFPLRFMLFLVSTISRSEKPVESIISPAVLTLCACTPPLDQVLKLWDFLLAFGVHLNVLCVIAQLLLMRDDVMASSR
jgi:cell cycle arrest protein BUB2